MNKKIFFLLVFYISLFSKALLAQCQFPATNNCLGSNEQHVTNNSNWYYYNGGTTVNGKIAVSPSNAPTSTTGGSIVLSSYSSSGSGAFTCYNFEKGKTYRVCYWVRNNSGCPTNNFGTLFVYATRGLTANLNSGLIPPVPKWQRVDTSYNFFTAGAAHGPGQNCLWDWKFVSTTFTANDTFNNLVFFPLNPMGSPTTGTVPWWNLNYTVEIDDIRVTEEPSTPPYTLSISSPDTIGGCDDSTEITLSGMPTGAVATWTPAVKLKSGVTDGSVVIAKPCSTTSYKVEIVDPTPQSVNHCPTCIKEVFYHTVVVNQWSDPSRLIYSTTPLPCTLPFDLEYDPDPNNPCPQIGFNDYVWVEPDALTTHTGRLVTIPAANALQTGEWTLRIINSAKGCAEEHKFMLTIASCCISNPDFTYPFDPSTNVSPNPVPFTYTGNGIINQLATLWSFGDGSISNQPNPIHNYNVTTTTPFIVCLTTMFEDDQGEGCCNRICKTITVEPETDPCEVVADFNFTLSPFGVNNFDFTDASTGTGTFCEYEWTFNGQPPVITPLPTIQQNFPPPGPWLVCLKVTNCVYDPATGAEIKRCTSTICKWVSLPPTKPAPGTENPAQETQPQLGASPINENNQDNALAVYPNPNKGNFTLSLNNRKGSYEVMVRDKLGREVYKRKHEFNNTPIKITLNDVSSGIYTVEVKNDKEKFVEQISITR